MKYQFVRSPSSVSSPAQAPGWPGATSTRSLALGARLIRRPPSSTGRRNQHEQNGQANECDSTEDDSRDDLSSPLPLPPFGQARNHLEKDALHRGRIEAGRFDKLDRDPRRSPAIDPTVSLPDARQHRVEIDKDDALKITGTKRVVKVIVVRFGKLDRVRYAVSLEVSRKNLGLARIGGPSNGGAIGRYFVYVDFGHRGP